MRVRAPWTEKQVASLVRWQSCDRVHAFTTTGCEALIPTRAGWIEGPGGEVVQDWAHRFMLEFRGCADIPVSEISVRCGTCPAP